MCSEWLLTVDTPSTESASDRPLPGKSAPKVQLKEFLDHARTALSYAFQPITNIHTGSVYGYESLLQGLDHLGVDDVFTLLDHAWHAGFAWPLEETLREMAVSAFARIPNASRYRLFYYDLIAAINARDKCGIDDDRTMIGAYLESIPPLNASDSLPTLFDAFRRDKTHNVIPVLDDADRPLGLVHESDIKEHIYSIYGRDLMVNRAFARRLLDFVRPCALTDCTTLSIACSRPSRRHSIPPAS